MTERLSRFADLVNRSLAVVAYGWLFTSLAAPAVAGPAPGDLEASGLAFEPRSFAVRASPPLPDPAVFPVQLVLDDDGAEGIFGFAGSLARQFLWLNRFSNPGRFSLEEIWVLFPSGMDVPLGGEIQLAVYLDPDADPATGAQLLATYSDVIQAIDGDAFSIYPLATPLAVEGPGEVLIGVVNRYFETGVDPPPTQPASRDTTASQGRSHFATWTGDADDPPDLATATLIGAVSGNFMIRAFGTPLPPLVSDVPALGPGGLAGLIGLLGLAGGWLARRSRRGTGPR